MELPTTPEFLIGQYAPDNARRAYFYVASRRRHLRLDNALDTLIPSSRPRRLKAGIAQVGPVVVRYYPADKPNMSILEIGVPVRPETQPAGVAQIKTLPPLRCASLLYWGSLAHITQAYETLIKAIRTPACRTSARAASGTITLRATPH